MRGKLLVVTIDRLPAWMLPVYGATWVSMPRLTALAGRGVVFDAVVATAVDPLRTAADLLGGASLPLLAAAGPAAVVTDDAQLARGVAAVAETRLVEPPAAVAVAVDDAETGVARLCDAAAAVVAAGRHRLVWCHAASLAAAWDAPDAYRDAYVDPDDPPPPAGAAVPDVAVSPATDPDLLVGIRHVFAAQMTLLDGRLARLLDAAEDWTILVAGVRGMPLGLHGRVGCGPLPPYGELVRLPAVLVDAGGRMAAQRYGGLVVPADLGATLRRFAGLDAGTEAPRPWEGRSLAGLFENWSCATRDRVLVTTTAGDAVVTPGWHLVIPSGSDGEDGRSRLFAKPDDYFELSDVADRCPAVVAELRGIAAAAARGDLEQAWQEPLSPAALGSS